MKAEQSKVNATLNGLLDDRQAIERIFHHIDNKTTDMGKDSWQEPTFHYLSETRFQQEKALLLQQPLLMCPASSIPKHGCYYARDIQGVPLFVVRDHDGQVRAFKNACRHRGVKVAQGSGRQTSFVCPYHAWTYGTDGALKVIPHREGFPAVKLCDKSLVAVPCIETRGLIWVCLANDAQTNLLADLPELVPQGYHLYHQSSAEIPANWKIVIESFLEGYHIKSTHPKSFYPVQFDNLNLVEQFGPHSRVCFPYRAVEKLRDKPQHTWQAENRLTYVHHLFPNTLVTTHPGFRIVVNIEPVSPSVSLQHNYVVSNVNTDDEQKCALLEKAVALAFSSIDEDRAMVCSAQAGLRSNANEHLEFGLFESAIVHFHRTLTALLDEV